MIQQKVGLSAVSEVEEKSQLASIKKYGTYTDFRHLLNGIDNESHNSNLLALTSST